MEQALLEGSVEIAAAMLPLDARQFEILRFAGDRLVLVIERQHSLAQRRSVRIPELAEEAFVLLTKDFRITDLIQCVRATRLRAKSRGP